VTVNVALTFARKLAYRHAGEKDMRQPSRGKTAWAYSARAFEASRNPLFPRLLRHVCVRAGVVCFWTALALDRRAIQVWREQRVQRGRAGHRQAAAALTRWSQRLRERLGWRGEQWVVVPAWSLPDSAKMRGLGLGRMWAVLCPFCEEFHTHSPGEGGRMPHCCGERDRQFYALVFAGPLPVRHRARFYRSSKSGLPRLLHRWPEAAVQSSEVVGLLAA
jgi:hypothetical protein